MQDHKVYSMTFASIYKSYLNKVTRKDRTEAALDDLLKWLTQYDQPKLEQLKVSDVTLRTFMEAADLNENRHLITGSICGIKIAEIDEPLMKEIRYMDKIVDELAKGKALSKIKRTPK